MTKLSYITIPIQLYADKKLCEIQRAILGLATAFGNRGLKMSDDDLAATFNVTRQWINKLISELNSEGYIRIEKPGSKYRVIYCQEKSTVQSKLLSSIVDSKSNLLSTPTCSTVDSELTHKERSKEERNTKDKTSTKKGVSFVEFMNLWNSHGTLPKIHTFTKHRKRILATRSKEPEFADNWELIIDKLSRSPFHTGQNNRKWRADIDWLLKNDTNYVKILELIEPDFSTREVSETEAAELMAEVSGDS